MSSIASDSQDIFPLMARGVEEEAADNAAVVSRLVAALQNPELSDLVIMSDRDGSKTATPAFLLASCSPVFTRMLTEKVSENADHCRTRKRIRTRSNGSSSASTLTDPSLSTQNVMTSSFSGDALTAIVMFAATNDAPALWTGSVKLLGEILMASVHYDISALGCKAKNQLIAHVTEAPKSACHVLESVWKKWSSDAFGAGLAGEVAHAALKAFEVSAAVALKSCGCLSEGAMKKILSSPSVNADENAMFSALQRWVNDSGICNDKSRNDVVERLVACLSFEKMTPSFLKNVVANSGLVSKEVLFDVFQEFSVKSETENGFTSKMRSNSEIPLPHWCTSSSVVCKTEQGGHGFEFLERAFDSGCWVWDLQIEKLCGKTHVGLVFCHKNYEKWSSNYSMLAYGISGCGWLLHGEKGCWERAAGDDKGPSFSEGDMIRVSVDCGNGTFNIQINGGVPHEVFSGIKLPSGIEIRPAVMIEHSDRIRLLSFWEVRSENKK